jgi:hypothetical protein
MSGAPRNPYLKDNPVVANREDETAHSSSAVRSTQLSTQLSNPSNKRRNTSNTVTFAKQIHTSPSGVRSPTDNNHRQLVTPTSNYNRVNSTEDSITTEASTETEGTPQGTLQRSVGEPRGDMPLTSIKRKAKGTNQPLITTYAFVSKDKRQKFNNKTLTTSSSCPSTFHYSEYDDVVIRKILEGEDESEYASSLLNYELIVWDPRGYEGDMPSGYCLYCRCPQPKCHNKIFGKFCELMVVQSVFVADVKLHEDDVVEIFRDNYNCVLQFKIFEETGQLDVKHNGYEMPRCVVEESLQKSLAYVRYMTYHFKMHRCITEGRELQGGQAFVYDEV